ncbi:hypothetical protein OJ593_10070, partial [Streptococcus anginosus]|nr:hypothetical protein [Streptococcus anginosus]
PILTPRENSEGLDADLYDEADEDNGNSPNEGKHHGDAVEVAFGYAGGTHGRGNAATEHIGDSAALAFVQQDGEREEDAGDEHKHFAGNEQSFHFQSFRVLRAPGE